MKDILIIEDSKLHQQKIKNIISEIGYNPKGFFDYGQQALDYIFKDNNQPDLIIIDIVLKGEINGYQVAKKITSEITVPIIFITSSEIDISKNDIKDLEASVYLNKPFTKKEIKNNINLVLHKYEMYKKIQHNIKEKELLLESINIQIWYLKDKKTYGKVNKAHADFLGFDKKEIENKKLENFMSKKEAEICKKGNKKVFNKKEKITTKEWFVNNKGEKRLLSINKNPKLNENDQVEFIVCSAKDITSEHKLEQKLRQNRNYLKSVINTIPDIIMLLDENVNCRDVWTSRPENLLVSKQELIGENLTKFLPKKVNDKFKKSCYQVVNGEEMKKLEYKLNIEGNIKYFEANLIAINKINNENEILATIRNITESKKLEKKLKYSQKRYKTIFKSAPIGIIIEDDKGKILEVNEKMAEMSGYKKEELEGENVIDKFVLPKYKNFARENIKKLINGKDLNHDIETPTKKGEEKNYHLKETNITLPNGNKGIISMHLDITKKKKKEKEIEYLSYRDQLTELYNRRFLEEEIERLDTKRQLPISIIMADVNGLKIINDTYGHSKGDELLIRTGEILINSIRKEDLLARWGGDEFVILLPQTKKKKAQKIVKRIKHTKKKLNNGNIPVSIGLGIATKNKAKEDIDEIIEKADDNMYKNKLSESRSSKSNIVQGLLNTLETKSSETKEHVIRMTNLDHKLGERLKLSNSELNKLYLLATLHDIGKTTISEKILTKPGSLTDEEWEIIKEHPKRGYKIASASEEFVLVAEEILSHHEHWDGSGYPRGLAGKNIPYLARIISIIDAYDVMTNDRPYSKAISKEKALEEIKNCAGTQFDPELAEEFIEFKTLKKI